MRSAVKEWWGARDLAAGLLLREVRARYRASALGLAWSLLQPAMMLAIYAWVFTQLFRLGVPKHLELMVAGLFPWTAFAAGLAAAAGAVVGRGDLVRKVPFPQELLPGVAIATHLVQWALAFPVVLAFLWWRGCPPQASLLALPLLVLLQAAWTLGLGLALAALAVRFRDVEPLVGVLLAAAFYLAPVVYPVSLVPEAYQAWYRLNPMASLVEAHQGILVLGQWPALAPLGVTAFLAGLALALGLAFFRRERLRFAERL